MDTCVVIPAPSISPSPLSTEEPKALACTLQDGSQSLKTWSEAKGYICYPALQFKFWLESLQARSQK